MKQRLIKLFISDYYIEIIKFVKNLIEKRRIKKSLIVNMNKLIKKIKKYFENNTYTIEEKYQRYAYRFY